MRLYTTSALSEGPRATATPPSCVPVAENTRPPGSRTEPASRRARRRGRDLGFSIARVRPGDEVVHPVEGRGRRPLRIRSGGDGDPVRIEHGARRGDASRVDVIRADVLAASGVLPGDEPLPALGRDRRLLLRGRPVRRDRDSCRVQDRAAGRDSRAVDIRVAAVTAVRPRDQVVRAVEGKRRVDLICACRRDPDSAWVEDGSALVDSCSEDVERRGGGGGGAAGARAAAALEAQLAAAAASKRWESVPDDERRRAVGCDRRVSLDAGPRRDQEAAGVEHRARAADARAVDVRRGVRLANLPHDEVVRAVERDRGVDLLVSAHGDRDSRSVERLAGLGDPRRVDVGVAGPVVLPDGEEVRRPTRPRQDRPGRSAPAGRSESRRGRSRRPRPSSGSRRDLPPRPTAGWGRPTVRGSSFRRSRSSWTRLSSRS